MTQSSQGDAVRLSPSLLGVPGTVLLDDWSVSDGDGTTYLFIDPLELIVCHSHDTLDSCLEAIARAQANGRCAAGFISYDAGLGLDKPLVSRHTPTVPLLWMGVYERCIRIPRRLAHFSEWDDASALSAPRLNIADDEYLDCVERIKDHIRDGDVYQVNYTCKLRFDNSGSAAGMFARLREAHPVCHGAFVNTGDFQIASLSPELFLRRTGNTLITRPMKGTARRGLTCEEDDRLADALQCDPKNRAENVMILDLMRNDLGRLCEYGSVSVPAMFDIERYRTVLQMTSTALGTLRAGVDAAEIIRAVFPPGSVTGAPKMRALEIIDELEHEARGAYCGCVGAFFPGGDMLANVAIRTIVQRDSECEMGVGSGIVADSDPAMELEEVLLKGRFLGSQPVAFELLETLLYRPGQGYSYLNEHIARMRGSAAYFGYKFDESAVRLALTNAENGLPAEGAGYRVRVLIAENGEVRTEWQEMAESTAAPVSLLMSSTQTDPNNVFLYHKTTNRETYDREAAEARAAGFFDTLYLNSGGELTECAIANICVRIGDEWYTPPTECGLLPGLWRSRMIRSGRVSERVIKLEDLASVNEVTIGNSVRGEVAVESIRKPDGTLVWPKS